VIKPRTVMFGEAMPREETEEAERRARASELFIVVGSSLVVYPAAQMPVHAKRAGARLVIINRTPTPQDDEADLLIADSSAAVLSNVAAHVAGRQTVT
ncbi:MAG TPA: Sir2 family NAD-dependent protein deacetylase, partial [Methylomirabilota bacterium]